MEILLYDGSFAGFLTSVFESYDLKLRECKILNKENFQPDAFTTAIDIYSDETKALRVWNGLKKKISKGGLYNIYSCHLSEDAGVDQVLFAFIRHIFSSSRNVEKDFGNDAVLKVAQIAKKVWREKHRFEAFIRFQLLKDGLYFAPTEPDFNVLPLLISHFQSRYSDQRWLIYDIKREYGIYYNLNDVEYVKVNRLEMKPSGLVKEDVLHPDEYMFQELWKDYFKSVNIASRKNLKLHIQHMPRRYWKHLTEKQ